LVGGVPDDCAVRPDYLGDLVRKTLIHLHPNHDPPTAQQALCDGAANATACPGNNYALVR
jgi:hypothetical protein